jgi:hypothetical protein
VDRGSELGGQRDGIRRIRGLVQFMRQSRVACSVPHYQRASGDWTVERTDLRFGWFLFAISLKPARGRLRNLQQPCTDLETQEFISFDTM